MKQKDASHGRKILIVVVIITSALSFALGYFVGNAGQKEKPSVPQAAIQPLQEQAPQIKEQPSVATTVQPAAPVVKEEKPLPEKKITAVAEKKEKIEPSMKDNKTKQPAGAYTVQAGAFKNIKDAEFLKAKLAKKGYKAYIKKSKAAKDEKLFKVRIGDFVNRKDAEDLTAKLKEQGLKAFVASKNEETAEMNKNASAGAKQEKPR